MIVEIKSDHDCFYCILSIIIAFILIIKMINVFCNLLWIFIVRRYKETHKSLAIYQFYWAKSFTLYKTANIWLFNELTGEVCCRDATEWGDLRWHQGRRRLQATAQRNQPPRGKQNSWKRPIALTECHLALICGPSS